MAYKPTWNEWNNINANFSGSSSMMNSASKSVKNAGDTIGNIINSINNQRANEERTGVYQARENRQLMNDMKAIEEAKKKEVFKQNVADTTTELLKGYRNFKTENKNATLDDYRGSKMYNDIIKNTDSRVVVEADNIVNKNRAGVNKTVSRGFDVASKEKEFKEGKEIDNYYSGVLNNELSYNDFKAKLNNSNVSAGAKSRLLKSKREAEKAWTELQNQKAILESNEYETKKMKEDDRIAAELGASVVENMNGASTDIEKAKIAMDASITAEALGIDGSAYRQLANTYSLMFNRTSSGSDNSNDNKKSLKNAITDYQNNGMTYLHEDTKKWNVDDKSIKQMDALNQLFMKDGLFLKGTQIMDAALQAEELSGITYFRDNIYNENANTTVHGLSDMITTYKGKKVIDTTTPFGMVIYQKLQNNADRLGKSNASILQNTAKYYLSQKNNKPQKDNSKEKNNKPSFTAENLIGSSGMTKDSIKQGTNQHLEYLYK